MKGMRFMKIGLISDIHGNKKALDAVLKQLEKKKIDKIICIGDLVGRCSNVGRSSAKNNKYGTKSSCSKRKSRKLYN